MAPDLPPAFQQRIRGVFREAGAAWLDKLPALLEHVAAQWDLTLGAPFDLSYNDVTAATRNGEAVVLKTGAPNPELLTRALSVRAELLASMNEIGLLHGDLHHLNILSSERAGWLLIDPKGVAGERAFECGPLLLNPWRWTLNHPAPERLLARRLDILADELTLDRRRLAGWAAVHAVLSACWSAEDGDGGQEALLTARALFSLF